MDPALAALLHELWAEPAVEPTKRKPGKKDKDKEWDWPDTLSGLWRMLDSYDEFVCSPAGFHAFRQVRRVPRQERRTCYDLPMGDTTFLLPRVTGQATLAGPGTDPLGDP